MANSMWNLPDTQTVLGPVQIMREQGEALEIATNGKLQGRIQTHGSGSDIISEFNILVPNLGYYSYTLCAYEQKPLAIYPGRFFSSFSNSWFSVANEDEFRMFLSEMLGSQTAKQLLSSLLSQAS